MFAGSPDGYERNVMNAVRALVHALAIAASMTWEGTWIPGRAEAN